MTWKVFTYNCHLIFFIKIAFRNSVIIYLVLWYQLLMYICFFKLASPCKCQGWSQELLLLSSVSTAVARGPAGGDACIKRQLVQRRQKINICHAKEIGGSMGWRRGNQHWTLPSLVWFPLPAQRLNDCRLRLIRFLCDSFVLNSLWCVLLHWWCWCYLLLLGFISFGKINKINITILQLSFVLIRQI